MKSLHWAAVVILAAGLSAPAAPTSALDLARQLNDAFVQVADQVSPSVVVIEVKEKQTEEDSSNNDAPWHQFFEGHPHHHWRHAMEGEGSGVILTPDGYILTNNHVVDGADTITVRLKDGRKFTARIQGVDPQSDIAVIKIDASGLPAASLGDSDNARVGEFVLAIGAPFDLTYSVTVGHISAKGRYFDDEPGYVDQDYIQTDASINPGNSGGPLVNLYGEVIGINAMIEGENRGIGFAVPINLAKRVKDHLISEGRFTRSWLGIEIETLREDDDYREFIPGLQDGVVVDAIMPDGPAANSTLRAGDVIVAVDGKTVRTMQELKDEISIKPPGRVVNLDVVREKSRLAISVATAALPTQDTQEESSNSPAPGASVEADTYGLTVQALNHELSRQYRLDAKTGIVVTAVEQDSPAEDQGMKEGDLITEVNHAPVATLRQFRDALKSGNPKMGLLIHLISDGAQRVLVLKPGDQ